MPILPFAFARDHQVLLDRDHLYYADRPSGLGLREARRRAGQPLTLTRLTKLDFEKRLSAHYQQNEVEQEAMDLMFDLAVDQLRTAPRDLLDKALEAPVIALVNQLFRTVLRDGGSDLHLEPQEAGLTARMRQDGVLQTIWTRSDVPTRQIVARIKVMAGLDTAETRLPQDGRIGLRYCGRKIDVRVSTLPGAYGERAVMRVLDRQTGLKPMDALGLTEQQDTLMRHLTAHPNGILLATGPTGSGKTTTLYSLLQLMDCAERNIMTVEDPIEYQLPGLNQTQIHAEIGFTYSTGLRAALRQDPDVIFVGEIRDRDTAQVAAQAALTGHLVLSSLHANDAISAIARLRDLGLEDGLIAATLRGIFAQRLLRKTTQDGHYSGRQAAFEVLEIETDAAAQIAAGADDLTLRRTLLPDAYSMLAHARALVAQGVTNSAEVRRVFGVM